MSGFEWKQLFSTSDPYMLAISVCLLVIVVLIFVILLTAALHLCCLSKKVARKTEITIDHAGNDHNFENECPAVQFSPDEDYNPRRLELQRVGTF